MHFHGRDDDFSGKIYSLPDIANDALEKVSDNTTDEKMSYFLQSLPTTPRNANEMERRTRGQSDNDLWITARQGRLTASNHHAIFTKMNSVTRSAIKPSTTPLVSKNFKGGENLSQVEAVSCGRDHESVAMKAFHVAEAIKHRDYQLQNCGLYIDHKKSYIAASPDGFFMCKCHGSVVIEIKCPFKIRNKTVREGLSVIFLPSGKTTVSFSKLHISITHRSLAQMALTKSKLCYFVTS